MKFSTKVFFQNNFCFLGHLPTYFEVNVLWNTVPKHFKKQQQHSISVVLLVRPGDM